MGKRLEKLNKIQDILGEIAQSIRKLFNLMKDEPINDFKKQVASYLLLFSKLNMNFSFFILNKAPESYKKDKIDTQFKDIIKQLKKKGKNE